MERPYRYQIDIALEYLSARATNTREANVKDMVRDIALELAFRGYRLNDNLMSRLDIEMPEDNS